MDKNFTKGKCSYCGKTREVKIVQAGVSLSGDAQGLLLEDKIRDFINTNKDKRDQITGMPFLCEDCYGKIMNLLGKK